MMQFIKTTIRPYTQPEVFSLGLRSMKMHFSIFSGQQNSQTSISAKHCGHFKELGVQKIPSSVISQATRRFNVLLTVRRSIQV
jgi:hypothetical protein